MVMVIPKHYIEIDATKLCVRLPRIRLSTREKFRARRMRRRPYRVLREMIGRPINAETKKEVEKRIHLTLSGRARP